MKNLKWVNLSDSYAQHRMNNIKHYRPLLDSMNKRDVSSSVYMELMILFHLTTSGNGKLQAARVIREYVLPQIKDYENSELKLLMLGAGEGYFLSLLLSHFYNDEPKICRFNRAVLVEKSQEILPWLCLSCEEDFAYSETPASALRISQAMKNGEKIPLNYKIVNHTFPCDINLTGQADLVVMNYMLGYNQYSQWVNLSDKAFELVRPGGALVIAMIEPNHVTPDGIGLGELIKKSGVRTADINNFERDISKKLENKGASNIDLFLTGVTHKTDDKKEAECVALFPIFEYLDSPIHQEHLDDFLDNCLSDSIYTIKRAEKLIVVHKQ